MLAQIVGRGEPSNDFILMHGICRRSFDVLDSLDDVSLVALLQACAKTGLYDEEFLAMVSTRICEAAGQLPTSKATDTIFALGVLQVRDASLFDALCEALTPRVREFSEPDLVRCLRGFVRLRHADRGLLGALAPEVERQKWTLNSLSLGNIISALSFLGVAAEGNPGGGRNGLSNSGPVFEEGFFSGLMHVVTARINNLSSTSVQHVLTGLCRQQGRMRSEALAEPLKTISVHLATPTLAMQLTPVQAIGSLSALAKLRFRDLPALSVLLSVLVGRGANSIWNWASSANFYAHASRPLPASPFDEAHCLNFLRASLDVSHYVEIVQGVHRLDLHGALPLRLSRLVWEQLLKPQLHDLRAREVLAVARALGASRLELGAAEEAWKADLACGCFEALRRHEFYLESAWNTLLPFKLLCLEIEAGAFGSRGLNEILNPTLLGFVERLRGLTWEECEQNRLQREGADEEDEPVPRSIPRAEASVTHMVHGFPVDILVPMGLAALSPTMPIAWSAEHIQAQARKGYVLNS